MSDLLFRATAHGRAGGVRRGRALLGLLPPGWALCCLALASGCFVGDQGAEEDHLEHHTPPHRPTSLAAGVREVSTRWPALAASWSASPAETAEQQLRELHDILGWLPELAAETDLPEAPWSRLRAAAEALAARLPQSAAPRGAFPPAESVAAELVELRSLAEQADRLSAESLAP